MVVNNSTVTVDSQPVDQPAENVEAEVLVEQVDSGEETDVVEQPDIQDSGEDSFMGKGFDPNSLKDPELQKAYKQMQSNWTKKNQGFSSKEQRLQQLEDWEKGLNSNPYFQRWADDMQRMSQMQQAGVQDMSNMTEEERINFVADKKIKEYMERDVNPRVKTLEQERASARVDKFLTDFPDAKKYAVTISGLMKKHPTLDMQTAWKLVKSEFAKDEAKKEVLSDLEVKGNANLELPGKQASQPAKKAKMTVEEAAELAERQTGYKW